MHKNVISILVTLLVFQLTGAAQQKINDFNSKPSTLWTFKCPKAFYSSPIVENDMVHIGCLDSTLYTINTSNGNKIWVFKTKGEVRSNVCINGDRLFLNGGDGILYAIDKRSGKAIWQFETNGERKYDFADYFHSTPIYKDGIIYFGSGDGNLYAIIAENGKLKWKFKTDGIVHTTPAIDNGKVFFGSFDGYVYAITISTGELKWKFKTVGHKYFPKGEVQGSPSTFKNLVFIGARDYNVYAIDQEKGFCHWNKAFTRGWGLCNNINDSTLYIGSADERVLISAIPESGKENWRKNMEFLVFGNNAYSENMMYVGTTIGKFHGIDIKTGNNRWSFETESYILNRSKYFKPDDSYRDDIYSIIKSNEHFLEVECELGGIFSTPAITENQIIFSSTNGTIYCLRR